MGDTEARTAPELLAARLLSPVMSGRGTAPVVLAGLLAVAVAVAFADSSIVVLALPELYTELDTTIPGVSFVVTSYNLVVAVGAFVLLPLTRRFDARRLLLVGLLVFGGASIGCAASGTLELLIAFRAIQGLGAVLLLIGSLPVLIALFGDTRRGSAVWTLAGTLGAALGPALGGALTQAFDWRSIFIVQAPIAFLALLATLRRHQHSITLVEPTNRATPAPAANTALALLFGALVGALFLGVLLLVAVWGLSPLAGAAVVSALPIGTLGARFLSQHVSPRLGTISGAVLLALGLAGLALLPSTQIVHAAIALGLCGVGLGLAVPSLSDASISVEHGIVRSSAWSIGSRHIGLVAVLVLIAPLLAWELERGGQQATLAGTAEILDAPVPLTQKVPLALDLRDEFERTPRGQVPDLDAAFANNASDGAPGVAALQESLLVTIEDVMTRSFRSAFALAGLFSLLAILPMAFVTYIRRKDTA